MLQCQVADLRGSLAVGYPSSALADKAYNMFRTMQSQGKIDATFGCLDPVQVMCTEYSLNVPRMLNKCSQTVP